MDHYLQVAAKTHVVFVLGECPFGVCPEHGSAVYALLDEGCTKTVHFEAWEKYAEPIMEKMDMKMGELDDSRPTKVRGVGEGSSVGKRPVPTAMVLSNGNAVRFTVKSNVLPDTVKRNANHKENTLLLSLQAQKQLGLIKDVRAGTAYLKDYGQYVTLYQMKGTRLRAVRISGYDLHEQEKCVSTSQDESPTTVQGRRLRTWKTSLEPDEVRRRFKDMQSLGLPK